MYRITATNPDGSSYVLYDPVGAGALPILAPRCTEELNEPGSLEFALVYGHAAYEMLMPKKTYISVELDGREIMYGRVVNTDPSPMTGQIQYMCAGALSFLNDSEVPPDPKKSDGSTDFQTMTAEAFFRKCIAAHNADIGNDPRRTFTIGTISHSRKSETRQYQINGYNNTKSVLDQQLLDYYGGFLRTRRENGTLYIDWVEQYGDTDAGVLDLGRNIINLTNRANGEDLFTAIRPVGANGITLSGGGVIDIFPQAEMSQYGRIVRNVTFSDAQDEATLRTKANALVSRLVKTVMISSEISLVDLKFADEDAHGVNLGDVFTHIVGLEGIRMTVSTRNRDIEKPQNDSVSLKSPKAFETDAVAGEGGATKKGGGISRKSSAASAGVGMAYKYIHEFSERLELNTRNISINADELELHADMFVETANEFARLSHVTGDLQNAVGEIQGTGVIQNSESITELAGRFVYDAQNKKVTLINGTALEVFDNGTAITVGERLTRLTDKTATFEGSALWTQRNQITGVAGEFDVETDPSTGEKTLKIKSGGGLKITEGEQEFGFYHEGSLTGGVIVRELNARTFGEWTSRAEYPVGATVQYNGHGYVCKTAHRSEDTFDRSKWEKYTAGTNTRIKGDVVDIEARQVKIGSTSNVESWMNSTDIWKNDTDETLDDYEGLIADRATIAQLNAAKARISNIEADYIATGNLAANIANITNQLSAWNARFYSASASDLIILGADSQGHETRSSVKTFLKQVQVVPTATAGEYVLQYKTYNDTDWQDAGTFSKAASINNLTGSWSGATLTVETSPSTGKTYTVRLGTSASLGGDTNITMLTNGTPTQNATNEKYLDVPMRLATVTNGTPPTITTRYEETIPVNGTAVWNAGEASGLVTGWTNAYNKVVLPGQNTSSASATLKTPGATPTSNPVQNTNTFTLGNDGNNAVVLSYTMNSGTPITVARYEHNKYSAGETNGWTNAYNKVVLPTTNTSSNSAVLKTPGPAASGTNAQNSNQFYMSVGNDTADLMFTVNDSGNPITIARVTHNKYSSGITAGQNAVTISKSYDNSQSRVVFSKSAGTASTKAVKIGVKDSGSGLGWSGNTYTYRICDYEDSTQGVNLETNARTVDATARYNAGVTAGKNAVTLTDSGWSSGKVTFGKSEGTASTKTVQLTASSASWSGNTATVQIWDGTAADTQHGRNTGYTVSVNASGRYSAGVTDGKNAVAINKGSWSGGQISFTKSEGSASTKTVQLSAANPSWSGNTASVKIWDGTAADSQHGVDTGYTVTVDATARYNAGYTAGQGSIGIAVSAWGMEGDDETVTLTASSNPNGSSVKYSFRTSGTYWRDYNANIGYRGIAVWRSLGGSAYEYDHGFEVEVDATSRYNAGQNSVTITKSYDNSQSRVSFSKSAGTASTKAVKIGVKDSGSGLGWSGNTYTYRICDYEDNTQGVNLETNARTVDATARYNAGYTAGQGSIGIAVSAWGMEGDDETVTLTASSNPNGSSVKYSFRTSGTYWRDYNANIGYRGIAVWRSLGGSAYEYDHGFEVEVDATSRYNAGQNSVTISKTYDRANSRVSFSKSAGSADNKAVKIGIKDSGETGLGWNGTTYKYRICDYEDNQQGVNIENNPRTITHGIKIDGWGTESGNDTLGLSLSTNPNASSVKYSFRMSDTYWRSYNANIGYRGIAVWRSLGGGAYEYDHGFEVEVDATSRYNQGYADGGGGVTDSDFAGFNSITSYGSGDGYDTGGKLYVAGISKGSIKAPGYLAFRISCKGHTRYCYITINT